MCVLRICGRCVVSSLLPNCVIRTNHPSIRTLSMMRNFHKSIKPLLSNLPKPAIASFPTNSRHFSTEGDDDSSRPPDIPDSMTAKELLEDSRIESVDRDPDFPSDLNDGESASSHRGKPDLPHLNHSQQKHSFRTAIDPKSTTILLFPGQGSQFVGMGRELLEVPQVEELYMQASDILGYDLLDVCLNGPVEKLNQTKYCQPAVMVTSLAAVEKLKQRSPWAITHCVSAAGFSVGEYAALVFSGAFSFADAVQLIKVRAEGMQEASLEMPGGMMTTMIGHKTRLNFACHTAGIYCSNQLDMKHPVCGIASYLYPECKVIAGHDQALDFVEKNGREFNILRTKRLPVSGAFHTKLMRPAVEALREVVHSVAMETPIIPTHSNVHGERHKKPFTIKRDLILQLTRPVKWEQIMHTLYSRSAELNFPFTYELGPGTQLGTLLKKVNKKAFFQYEATSV